MDYKFVKTKMLSGFHFCINRRRTTTANRRLAKVAFQCSADSLVVNQSLVLRINICGKKSPPSPSAKTLAASGELTARQTNNYFDLNIIALTITTYYLTTSTN